MTKKNHWLAIIIVVIAAILAGLSFVGLLLLPDKIQSGPDIPHLHIYWLALGIIHCGLVLFLLGYWLVKTSKTTSKKRYSAIEKTLVIAIVILWILLIGPGARGNYLRNRPMKIPHNMFPHVTEPNNK